MAFFFRAEGRRREEEAYLGTLLLFGLLGEKKPTWWYPSSLRTLGREEAYLEITMFSFFNFSSFLFFSSFFGEWEGRRKSPPRGLLFGLVGEKKPAWGYPSVFKAESGIKEPYRA